MDISITVKNSNDNREVNYEQSFTEETDRWYRQAEQQQREQRRDRLTSLAHSVSLICTWDSSTSVKSRFLSSRPCLDVSERISSALFTMPITSARQHTHTFHSLTHSHPLHTTYTTTNTHSFFHRDIIFVFLLLLVIMLLWTLQLITWQRRS